MILDLSSLSANQAYFTLTQTVIPRPIAWVLTENTADSEGAFNLAPYSFFTAITGDPPILMFSCGQKPGGDAKDTLVNIERTRRFNVHIAGSDLAPALNESSATLDYGVSEVEKSQLDLLEFEGAPIPRLFGAPIVMSCELVRVDEIGNVPHKLVFGEVKLIWIDDVVVEHQSDEPFRLKLNAHKIDPLERLGGTEYAKIGELISLQRPD